MNLTIKLDGNWNSFQPANGAPPLSVTDSAIAPSARILSDALIQRSLHHQSATQLVPCQCNTRGSVSKLKGAPPRRKINVICNSPIGDISVVTLVRTDTTFDHSPKAEKVCFWRAQLLLLAHVATSKAFFRLALRLVRDRDHW